MQAARNYHQIGNKNEFISLCEIMGLPILPTTCISGHKQHSTAKIIHPQEPRIVKPVNDRLQLDDLRRRFFVTSSQNALELFFQTDDGRNMLAVDHQIQAYVDYHTHSVDYFNYTFLLESCVQPRIVTRQLINLSAIHHNMEALHWGNASVQPDHAILAGMTACERLAEYYWSIGYRGELGIDFGVSGGTVFLLETNARENNGTRLHKLMIERGWDTAEYSFVFMRNIPFQMTKTRAEAEIIPYEDLTVDVGDRKLLISKDATPIARFLKVVDAMSIEIPPVPY